MDFFRLRRFDDLRAARVHEVRHMHSGVQLVGSNGLGDGLVDGFEVRYI